MPRAAAVILAASLLARHAAAQAVVPGPLVAGETTFLFHSTIVGRLQGRAPIASAEFSGGTLADVRGTAEVRVDRMETGNGARDRHLRETLQADSYPVIRFEVDSVAPEGSAGDTTAVILSGRLVLHGVARAVRAEGTVATGSIGTEVTASFVIDMRDYGIRPPVRALLLRVAPDVAVTARLTFAPGRTP